MSDPTVGQIRAAIEGLADDAPVILMVRSSIEPPKGMFLSLESFEAEYGSLHIYLDAEPSGDDDDT